MRFQYLDSMRKMYLFTAIALLSCSCGQDNTSSKVRTDASVKWMGQWERTDWANEASLTIDSIVLDTIMFHIFASSGGNVGELEGKAIVTGNKARYTYKDETEDCNVDFVLYGDTLIEVNQIIGICGAGMGVEYSGKYHNEKIIPVEKNEKTLSEICDVDATDDSLLKILTGNDYGLFVASTQLITEENDLDSAGAMVYASAVRGLFTEMENIIMINDKKEIWAAVLDDHKVLYFTNVANSSKVLPKTIEHWRERFAEYQIVYKSAR